MVLTLYTTPAVVYSFKRLLAPALVAPLVLRTRGTTRAGARGVLNSYPGLIVV